MDYEKLKSEVQEIAQIAAAVPEQFQQRCFEVLLTALLDNGGRRNAPPAAPAAEREQMAAAQAREEEEERGSGDLPLNATVRAWMRRNSVTEQELASVLFVEDGQVHWVREPQPASNVAAQIEWAMLIALQNALTNNSMTVDAEAVRSIVQDKGYYDNTNFSKGFKKDRAMALFRAPLEPQGEAQALSVDGQQELARLVKRLAAAAPR